MRTTVLQLEYRSIIAVMERIVNKKWMDGWQEDIARSGRELVRMSELQATDASGGDERKRGQTEMAPRRTAQD
jgi:hypothetical protein